MSEKELMLDPVHECMSRDEMAVLQGKKLVRTVQRCYDNVPFYHNKMKDMGLEPGDIRGIEDIVKLPFTTKEDLRNNYPFGLRAVPQSEIVRVQGTSGTTGKLTVVPYTRHDVDVWAESAGRCLTMAGLTKEDIIHVCYCLPAVLVLILRHSGLEQWLYQCQRATRQDRSCVWKILERQHWHVHRPMHFILQSPLQKQEK